MPCTAATRPYPQRKNKQTTKQPSRVSTTIMVFLTWRGRFDPSPPRPPPSARRLWLCCVNTAYIFSPPRGPLSFPIFSIAEARCSSVLGSKKKTGGILSSLMGVENAFCCSLSGAQGMASVPQRHRKWSPRKTALARTHQWAINRAQSTTIAWTYGKEHTQKNCRVMSCLVSSNSEW